MIADEVTPVRSLLDLKYPISEGIIKDKEELELLWRYAITEKIGIKEENFKDHYCMLTEAPMNPMGNKKFMTETLLEKFQMGGCNIEPQAKLTLIYEGKESGLVLDSGDGVTHCIPVVHSMLDHHNIVRLNIAGRHITQYLIRLLQIKGYAFNSTADFETVREIKEKFCMVSANIEQDRKLDKETAFYNSFHKLTTTGKTILISNEKFEAPEILFNPMLVQDESLGIQDMVVNCIQSCPMDNRKKLYESIILSGATTLFAGFSSRLEDEVKKKYQKTVLKDENKKINIDINIIDNPNRQYAVFNGAVFLSNFYKDHKKTAYWISRQEWEECGEKILYQKCSNIIV
jgi:actin-related protein 2